MNLSTNTCLKEWNAIIEALGQGKQTIVIRKYGTTLNNFLLFPTVNYTVKDNYLENFKKEYRTFTEEYSLPTKEENKVEIKYCADVKEILEIPYSKLDTINKYHIWTLKHVKSYLQGKKAKIWVLRVYELQKPIMIKPTLGTMLYEKLKEKILLNNIEPVLSDSEFSKTLDNLIHNH